MTGRTTAALSREGKLLGNLWKSTSKLAQGIAGGDRASLSRAITLVESTRRDHNEQAELLMDCVLGERGRKSKAATELPTFRLGIAGPPGAGKSTFIEALGLMLINRGHRVAVLAVDPSSHRTGGSILGDKTRMMELSRQDGAYVRPSPTRGMLGGVAEHTNDVVLLCEAAGFDIVLIESVGVGQSEVAIDDISDMFLLCEFAQSSTLRISFPPLIAPGTSLVTLNFSSLLCCQIVFVNQYILLMVRIVLPPAGGDDLQGIKKGVMELADLVVVNKADGDLAGPARHSATDIRHALQLIRARSEHWKPKVKRCSALTGKGVDKVWKEAVDFRNVMNKSGETAKKRTVQARRWMWSQVQQQLLQGIKEAYGLVPGSRGLDTGADLNMEHREVRRGNESANGQFSPSSPSAFLNLSLDAALHEEGVDMALINGVMTPREAARMLVQKYLLEAGSLCKSRAEQ